jgi:hypothetical protein
LAEQHKLRIRKRLRNLGRRLHPQQRPFLRAKPKGSADDKRIGAQPELLPPSCPFHRRGARPIREIHAVINHANPVSIDLEPIGIIVAARPAVVEHAHLRKFKQGLIRRVHIWFIESKVFRIDVTAAHDDLRHSRERSRQAGALVGNVEPRMDDLRPQLNEFPIQVGDIHHHVVRQDLGNGAKRRRDTGGIIETDTAPKRANRNPRCLEVAKEEIPAVDLADVITKQLNALDRRSLEAGQRVKHLPLRTARPEAAADVNNAAGNKIVAGCNVLDQTTHGATHRAVGRFA